ncbi:MAG: hypothetical protein Q9163_003264 [Psora crenata]
MPPNRKGDFSCDAQLKTPAPERRRLRLAKLLSKLNEPSGHESSAYAKRVATTTARTEADESAEISKLKSPSQESVESLEHYYVPIERYEGRHRYDPKATWTDAEERALIKRLDVRVCAYCCLMFFALQLDRGNIQQALSDNFLDDLGLNTNDYNNGQTIFFVCFLCAELPSQLVSKKIGPDNWIPIQMISWSIVACCQAKITGRTTFFLTRALLGCIEGGFIPDIILYLSYFYKSKELPIRLSFFWGAYALTFIISAFLAYGILHLRGHHGMTGWQWLFALEGALTALIGVVSWYDWVYQVDHVAHPGCQAIPSAFALPDSKLVSRQKRLVHRTRRTNRIIRDDPSKGDMHNRQAVTPRLLWHALKDYDMWPIYLLGLTWLIPNQCAQAYLTLILRSLKFGTFETNLLTVPAVERLRDFGIKALLPMAKQLKGEGVELYERKRESDVSTDNEVSGQ